MKYLDKKYYHLIKPGDLIKYVERFCDVEMIHEGTVKYIACRCGLDNEGNLVSDDDYLIAETDFGSYFEDEEVNYSDILEESVKYVKR